MEGGGLCYENATIWGTLLNGRRQIVFSVNKAVRELHPSWVQFIHPNVKQTDGLLVVVKGKHTATFVRRLTHKKVDREFVALCLVVFRVPKAADTVTDTTLDLPADHLACVVETRDETRLNANTLKAEWKALRTCC